MPGFSISKEDLLRSKVVKPGVYVLLIRNITEGPGKNDPQSNVVTIDFVVESGPDANAIGVPIKHWLSEKAPGLAVGFIEAATGKKVPEDGIQLPEWGPLVGRKVKAYIKNDMYNGKPNNKIDGFVTV